MQRVFDIINYKFNDISLLNNAFTHSSYAHDKNISSNERLEFLGDSILGFVVSEYLYKNYTHDEGKLSKLKAQLVSANVLKDIINSGVIETIELNQVFRQAAKSQIITNVGKNVEIGTVIYCWWKYKMV